MDKVWVAVACISAPFVVSWMIWMTKKIFDQDKTLAQLTAHLASTQANYAIDRQIFSDVAKQVHRADRNIARIGEHLQVKHMESENN